MPLLECQARGFVVVDGHVLSLSHHEFSRHVLNVAPPRLRHHQLLPLLSEFPSLNIPLMGLRSFIRKAALKDFLSSWAAKSGHAMMRTST